MDDLHKGTLGVDTNLSDLLFSKIAILKDPTSCAFTNSFNLPIIVRLSDNGRIWSQMNSIKIQIRLYSPESTVFLNGIRIVNPLLTSFYD